MKQYPYKAFVKDKDANEVDPEEIREVVESIPSVFSDDEPDEDEVQRRFMYYVSESED